MPTMRPDLERNAREIRAAAKALMDFLDNTRMEIWRIARSEDLDDQELLLDQLMARLRGMWLDASIPHSMPATKVSVFEAYLAMKKNAERNGEGK